MFEKFGPHYLARVHTARDGVLQGRVSEVARGLQSLKTCYKSCGRAGTGRVELGLRLQNEAIRARVRAALGCPLSTVAASVVPLELHDELILNRTRYI